MNKFFLIIVLITLVSNCKQNESKANGKSILSKSMSTKLKLATNLTFDNPDYRIAFDGVRAVLESSKVVYEVNSDTGAKNEIQARSLCQTVSSFYIAGMTKNGFTYSCGKSLFKYEKGSSTLIKNFQDEIKWTETQGYFTAILLRNNHFEIYDGDHLLTLKDFNGPESFILSSSPNNFEIRSTGNINSYLYNFQIENREITECSFKNTTAKLYKQTYLPETNVMVGLAIEEGKKDFKILAINCKNQNIEWTQSVLDSIFKVEKGIAHLFEPSLTAPISTCGKDVCINLTNTEVAIGGKSQSGIYCFDSATGKDIWRTSSSKFDSYTGNDVAANIIGPSTCSESRLIFLRNSNSILYSQSFPFKNEAPTAFIDESDLKTLQGLLSKEFKFYTHDEYLPKITNGKIAFISSYKKLIILK